MNVRVLATRILFQVLNKGNSFTRTLNVAKNNIKPKDEAFLKELCYGVFRYLLRLELIANYLIHYPFKKTDKQIFYYLILVGIYQLSFMRIPWHAAVYETVKSSKILGAKNLSRLINAILRNYLRNKDKLDEMAITEHSGKYNHPNWILDKLKKNYPKEWQFIVEANNKKAPMWLRVNRQYHTRNEYLNLLDDLGIQYTIHSIADNAIKLASACKVDILPGFKKGWISVQDASAQLSVNYLKPKENELILDCCAAPGGKTTHILEYTNTAKVVALDINPTRLNNLHNNLERLKLKANVICGDARYPKKWWKGDKFDKILLDVPCSSTGVIRRHPDIKWLRNSNDIDTLSELQSEIIDAMWQELKSDGIMVYSTCSVIPEENKLQIKSFLERTKNAILIGSKTDHPGYQILPGDEDMDGFYYAVVKK
ncbi:16S rRNA (cytosine(967)-C(5))-methyltransferase RsmB [Candidatus Photodesmus anomalopis]|uniref:16S rRNA (cytosine(967)-C(5))-methyltransferase n=1 Tax=Candidatus Photodesmus katoptron Akat1 TaxID=1236703 RepID=S3DGC0_9GAMM|nr:16S rRNA (cytosine(967)-C(5))-methyltransferase RsmB [Candidatus Photodesmus katoptron]EPE37482.1 ribosomal RNA small subunit methyltransferase B [Candidatus Photodesmus katoptron Akat1]